MTRSVTAVLAALVALPALDASAEERGLEEERIRRSGVGPGGATIGDIVSLTAHVGGYWPLSDLEDGAFASAGAVGGTLTLWLDGLVPDSRRGLTDIVGLRGSLVFASTETVGGVPEPLEGETPNTWMLGGDLVLRLPIRLATGWLVPYGVGGLGAKRYDFDEESGTDFAGAFGAGAEYRFGRAGPIGLGTEVRAYVSEFDRLGATATQWDLVWTGTLSFNL